MYAGSPASPMTVRVFTGLIFKQLVVVSLPRIRKKGMDKANFLAGRNNSDVPDLYLARRHRSRRWGFEAPNRLNCLMLRRLTLTFGFDNVAKLFANCRPCNLPGIVAFLPQCASDFVNCGYFA